jgi:hypothetical protein
MSWSVMPVTSDALSNSCVSIFTRSLTTASATNRYWYYRIDIDIEAHQYRYRDQFLAEL